MREEVIAVTTETTRAIKELSGDSEEAKALLALMNYWGVTNLACITEAMGLEFLEKVRGGEIKIEDYLD